MKQTELDRFKKALMKDLRAGLRKSMYRRVGCRVCRKELGWMWKGIYGAAVYCEDCVVAASKGLRG